MAIDFPNSPTTGQIFTASNGTSWQWTGTVWVAAGTATGLITGAPNKLINPFMEIDQAHEGGNVTVSGYVLDGWQTSFNGPTITSHRATDAPTGYPNSLLLTVTTAAAIAAASFVEIVQPVEADDIVDTGIGTPQAQSLVFSWWVKTSVTGTYCLTLTNAAGSRACWFYFNVSTANTWQLFQQVFSPDTAGSWTTSGNGTGLTARVVIALGTNYQGGSAGVWNSNSYLGGSSLSNTFGTVLNQTFQLGPCGLWVAPSAQPLLRTSFQAELARCQRYYEKSYALGTKPGTASSTNAFSVYLPAVTANAQTWNVPCQVTKRAAPTATTYSSNSGASGVIYNSSSATDIAVTALTGLTNAVSLYIGSNNLVAWTVHWTLDARL